MSAPTSDAAIDVAIADEIEVAGYGTPEASLDHPTTDTTTTTTTRTDTDDRQESADFVQEPQGQQAGAGARAAVDGQGSGLEDDDTRGPGMLNFYPSSSMIRRGSLSQYLWTGLCCASLARSVSALAVLRDYGSSSRQGKISRNIWQLIGPPRCQGSCRHWGRLDHLRCALAAHGSSKAIHTHPPLPPPSTFRLGLTAR